MATTRRVQDYEGDSDLHTFVSRPDIRSPRFNVTVYEQDRVTEGYWFLAPYVDLHARLPTSLYSPSQVGPHIYDGNGGLVWSGAHLLGDRPTFDFKVTEHEGSQYFTFIAGEDLNENDLPTGSGLILDNTYKVVKSVDERTGRGAMNMHEFTTIGDGRRALMVTYSPKFVNVQQEDGSTKKMSVGNNGFSEVDTATGLPVFSWWALDHLDASESQVSMPSGAGGHNSAWDFFHMNSVDKNADGDYLISARYTNAIYKISGKDGTILWRLGGQKSDFKIDGFNFSSQHDARWQQGDGASEVITFFNNHSDGITRTANTSAAVEVTLDKSSMTATLTKSWSRPDGQLTKLRGNAQRLENDHMFVCWSENGYISEFDSDGQLLMEAQMASHRFNTYRAYKFYFAADPSEPIALKALVYGVSPQSSTTAYYVSWNGATNVAQWKFYSLDQSGTPNFVGSARRTGFETTFMASGVARRVLVEAFDDNDTLLGASEVTQAELPSIWQSESEPADASSASFGQSQADLQTASDTDHSQIMDHQLMKEGSGSSTSLVYVWTVSGIEHTMMIIVGAAFAGILLTTLAIFAQRTHRRRQPWTKCGMLRSNV